MRGSCLTAPRGTAGTTGGDLPEPGAALQDPLTPALSRSGRGRRQGSPTGGLASGLALAVLLAATAARAETLKVAVGQKGVWDTSVTVWGERAGFFKQEGLDLDILYTDGGAQTQQAVMSGGAQIGIGTGTLGVLSAAVRGAPVRVIEAEWHGASDLFWYVKAGSPIQTMKDAAGRTAGYSAAGSSSNLVLVALLQSAGVRAQPTPTGGPAATLVQVMSGQIDIGWSVPPLGLREEAAGDIRIIARGSDIPALADQTTRVNIANAGWLRDNRAVAVRFARAYDRSLAFAYSDPRAIEWFAEGTGTDPALARRVRDAYYPALAMQPDVMKGLAATLHDMVEQKRVPPSTTVEQLTPAIDLLAGP